MRVEMMDREILDSWKDISDYLGRDIKTCARWEKELGLPIHRIDQDSSRPNVFAYKSEIDEWLKDKTNLEEMRRKTFLKKRWAIIGSVSILALVVAVLVSLFIANGKYSSGYPENISIAVLPFEHSNFSEYEYYIPQGLSQEIFNILSRLDKLRVISAASCAGSANLTETLKDISQKYKVNHFLQIKLEKNDDELRSCVQLKRIKDEKIIWEFESEEKLENIFSLPEEICLKINEKLDINATTINAPAFKKGQTQDYLAFSKYLKGNHILSKANPENNNPWRFYNQGKYYQGMWTKESNTLAIHLFSQAIEIDENFTRAYIGLAQCYVNYINFNWDNNMKWLHKADELLEKAASINPECPEYYSTLIQVNLIKYLILNENTKNKACQLAQDAIRKYPSYPRLYAQAGYCHYLNFAESGNVSEFNKALEFNEEHHFLQPHGVNNIIYAELLMLNKDYDKALTICSEIQGGESSLMADFKRGEIYYHMGDLDASETVFQQLKSRNDFDFKIGALFYLAMIAAQKEEATEVARIFNKIKVISPKKFDNFEDKLKSASIYMGIGEKELGYKCLEDFFADEKIKKTRYIYHKYMDIDRNFNNCRDEQRFKNIIQ